MILDNMLLWLAFPLLAAPFTGDERRSGAAFGRLAVAALGLGALQRGAATLDPTDLRAVAATSGGDAWFIGISAGLLIAAAAILPRSGKIAPTILGLPLAGAALFIATPNFVPLLVGICAGLLPFIAGRVLGRWRRSAAAFMEQRADGGPVDRGVAGISCAAIALALIGPALLATVFVAAATWLAWWKSGGGAERRILLPVIASTLLLCAWVWLALTVAATPLASFASLAADAPISDSAGQALALIAVGWAVAQAIFVLLARNAARWLLLAAVATVTHFAAGVVTPEATLHWQPVISTVLVAAVLLALAFGRSESALAAVTLLAATRPGTATLIAALALALWPMARRVLPSHGAAVAAIGAVFGVVIVSMLRDQVLLAVILALGVATLAIASDRVVARASAPSHL